jgi:hypothetical protein
MITFIATAHKENIESYILITSLILQKDQDWKCIIVCDGKNEKLKQVVEHFNDPRISLQYSEKEVGFWGHENRANILNLLPAEGYVVQVSIQDYYLPSAVEEIKKEIDLTDFVYFNCLHHGYSYELLDSQLKLAHIDWGCFAIKTELAKKVGIDNFTHAMCDGVFVEKLFKHFPETTKKKINKILFIHN